MGSSLTVVSELRTSIPPDPLPSDGRIAYRVGEAAEKIGVCRATFWRLMRAGEIPVVQIGSMKRILRRDLEAWLESHKEA
jgi:excisionase family DNA binding protein